nr:hypothetical protein CFP56_55480 [Quercus suber]
MLQDLYDDGFGFGLLWGEIWVFLFREEMIPMALLLGYSSYCLSYKVTALSSLLKRSIKRRIRVLSAIDSLPTLTTILLFSDCGTNHLF